ncbi:hypothetical protein PISL3812_09270 [Talaromyces islandicus]|uniref:Uncharacterized protein n=1 Tax=Talaromyces islandicus TaxID=28573 RepID=A0A0U1M987_TALIS|nr:hypothetical protein PISL3812_09270 [Talaromyces islandicus]
MRRVSAFRHFRLDFRQCRTYSRGRIFNTQQVRLRKPWIRRFATTCLVYGAAFHLWTSLVYLQFDSEITQSSAEDHVAQKGGAADEVDASYSEEEDASFIPLSWPRLREGELYAYTDPEWKAFAEIRADNKRMHEIKSELVKLVGKKVAVIPQFRNLLGPNLQINQEWLLPIFPYRAPPQYERYGLEISDTEIALVSQSMRPEDGDKMWKALFPVTVATATFKGLSVLYHRKMDRIQAFFGTNNAVSSTDKAIMGITHLTLGSDSKQPKNLDLLDFSEWETLNTNPAENKPPAAATTTTSEKPTREYPDRLPAMISMLQNVPFPDFTRGSDMYLAMFAFKQHLRKATQLHRGVPKRGVFYFTGPVSLKGPLGECRVDVRGEYDPSQKKYTGLWVKFRDITLYTQDAIAIPRFDQDG